MPFLSASGMSPYNKARGQATSGTPYNSQAQAIIDQMTANGSTPSVARQGVINQLVLDLKGIGNTGSDDAWSVFDVLQIYAAEDTVQAKTEWINANGTLDATEINSPLFTTDFGYTGASGKTIDTNYQPATDGTNYLTSNASVGVYIVSGYTEYATGIVDAGNKYAWIRNDDDGTIDTALNSASNKAGSFSLRNNYLATITRSNSSQFKLWTNGTLSATKSAGATGVPTTYTFVMPGINRATPSYNNLQGSIFYAGGDLSPYMTQVSDSFNAYLTSLSIYNTDALAIFNQMAANGSEPSAARKNIINQLVLDLKGIGNTGTADIWSSLDVLQVYAAEDSTQALTEWINADGTLDATVVNVPVFTVDSGYTGSTVSTIRSGFIASVNGVNYTLNNASMGVYSIPVINSYLVGLNAGNRSWIRSGSGVSNQALNSSGFSATNFGSNAEALYVVDRDSSTNISLILNDTIVTSPALGSTSLAPISVVMPGLASSETTFGNGKTTSTRIFFQGGSIKANRVQLYNSFNAYLTSL